MKTWIVICASLIALSSLTGCNTFQGFGQDVQRGGEKIEDAADRKR